MAKLSKRVLSVILSLTMMLTLLPTTAFASGRVTIDCDTRDGATVSVTGDLPEDATVSADAVSVDVEGIKIVAAYDINIYDGNGDLWQPEGGVEVTIQSQDFQDYEDLSVYHVDPEADSAGGYVEHIGRTMSFLGRVLDFLEQLMDADWNRGGDSVSFTAEHFSIYAIGTPYVATYTFYDADGGEIAGATQILKADEPIQVPEAPAKDGGVFTGWYLDGTDFLVEDGDTPSDLLANLTESDQDYHVYPRYEDVYAVYFLDEDGQVVKTIQASQKDDVAVSTDVAAFTPQGDYRLTGWSLEEDGTAVSSVSFDDAVDGAVYLYPVFQNAYWVHFDTQGGTGVASQAVAAGETVAEPAAPTRTGYAFAGWYTDPDCTDGNQVSFPYAPSASTTLYAKWSGEQAGYTVVIWFEKPNVSGTPDPTVSKADYAYYASTEATGAVGSQVTWTAADAAYSVPSVNGIPVGEFAYSETATVKGDGTTVLNVYCNRKVFTYQFTVVHGSMTIGGNTYGRVLTCTKEEHSHGNWWNSSCYELDCPYGGTGIRHLFHDKNCYTLVCTKEEHSHTSSCYSDNPYTLDLKYEQDIGDVWPSLANATFDFAFGGWDPDISNSDWVTKKLVVSPDMLPSSGSTVTLMSIEEDNERTVGYWFEQLPGQTGTTYTYNGVTYVKDLTYSQSYNNSGNLSPKDIAGFTNIKNGSGGTNFNIPANQGGGDNYSFLYRRNRWTLSFNTQGGATAVPSVGNVMFGQSLADQVPAGYVEGTTKKTVDGVEYTFTGWYTTAECYEKYNFSTGTMPNSNMTLFAGWSAKTYTGMVFTFVTGTDPAATWSIPYGTSVNAYLANNGLEMPEPVYNSATETFVGWCTKDAGGNLTLYPMDAPVTADVALYPLVVSTAGYQVLYHVGDGTGAVTDSQRYQYNTQAVVKAPVGVTAPTGKEFSHWVDGEGTIYVPGGYVTLPAGNITLTAVYVDAVSVPEVTVAYDANGGTGSMTGHTVAQNGAFTVQDNGFTAPAGYEFDGWNTQADGRGTAYAAGDSVRADTVGESVLYAQWKCIPYRITYDLQGGALAAGVTNPTSYTVEDLPITLVNPGREGHTFLGWTGSNGTAASDSVTIPAGTTGDLSYTANWDANSYGYVIHHVEKGTTNTLADDTTGQADFGTTVTVADKAGTIEGFAYDSDTDDITIAVSGNEATIYYVRNSYNVTYYVDGSQSGNAVPYAFEAPVTLRPEPSRDGYTFDGWYTNSSCTGTRAENFNMPAEDVNLYGKFTANTDTPYVVEFYLQNDDGSTYPTTASATDPRTGTTDTMAYVTAADKADRENGKYVFDSTYAGNVLSGNIAGNGSLVLKLYFKLNTAPWTVEYYYDDVKGDAPQGAATGGTGTIGTQASVTPAPGVTVGGKTYALDYTENNPLVIAVSGNVISVYYATDEIGEKDPDEPDQIPDKYQVTILYQSVDTSLGTVGALTKEVKTILVSGKWAENGSVAISGSTATATAGYFSGWSAAQAGHTGWSDDVTGEDETLSGHTISAKGKATYTYTANFGGKTQLTITVADKSTPYTGAEQSGYSYTSSSVNGLKAGHSIAVSYTPAKGTEAGPYGDGTFGAISITDSTTGADVSNQYTLTTNPGSLTITPIDDEVVVTITENSDTKPYTGSEQSVSGYTVTSISSSLYTASDFSFNGTAEAKGTDADFYPMGVTAEMFSNNSKNFTNVTFRIVDGGLTINPLAITITANSATKPFDGEPLTADGYTVAGTLAAGEILSDVVVTGSQTEQGESPNVASGGKIMKGGVETTGNYDISYVPGRLVVTAPNEYTITVNYLEFKTNAVIAKPDFITMVHGSAYDLDDYLVGRIGRYELRSYDTEPADTAMIGKLVGDIVLNVYYSRRGGPGPGPTPIPDDEVPLADVPGLNTVDHYAYIVGYEDNTVRPNSYITRAEVATIFFRLMTDEFRDANWATESIYSDVMVGSWYNNAICTATQASILTGYTDGTMQPNKNITRAEFAAIAARFLSEEYEGEDMFTDISGHWAAEYINRAARAGWIKGNGDGKFRPNDLITRAEAVTLINAMLDRAPDKDHMLADMKTWIDNPETAWFYEAIQEATNSHDYERETIIDGETWTELLANRDWVALEKMWSDSHSAPGGEVADNLNPNTTGDGD